MSENELPVSIQVRRPDGSVETVRVGTAMKSGEGYVLKLDLLIGAEGAAATRAAPRAAVAAASRAPAAGPVSGPLPSVFPPYGRSKGLPIAGASRGDLEFYANGSKRSLSDPSKSRFHDKERAMLAAIEAELGRQDGGGGLEPANADDEPPFPGDHDMPPPEDG